MPRRYFASALLMGVALGACAHSTKERTQTVTTVRETTTTGAVVTPAQPARVAGTINSGTTVSLMLQDSITSLNNHVGDVVHAVIQKDVKDNNGRVLFP